MIPPLASMRFRRLTTVTALLFGILVFGSLLFFCFAPLPDALRNPPRPSVEFLDRHEIPLRLLLVDKARYQQITPLDAISPHLINATIAAEDARFFHHHGVDPLSIARAAWNALRGHGPLSGASTITQQLAKLVETGPRTPLQKIQETWLALHIEAQASTTLANPLPIFPRPNPLFSPVCLRRPRVSIQPTIWHPPLPVSDGFSSECRRLE